MGGTTAGIVRTRYAPSPTGEQHIGGLRTALYNYLFARIHGGKCILRIEDTDQKRSKPGAVEDIITSLQQIGITCDESMVNGGPYAPYIQSQRQEYYATYSKQLIQTGHAYWAFDPPEELAALRESGHGYDGRGKQRSATDIARLKARGIAGVIRFVTPQDGVSAWDDLIVGAVRHPNKDIPCDPILLKSDGYPTYHLASVVDDHLMQISHVLRSQEWLSSTPLHIQLYRALQWEPPHFAHLSQIIAADGKKLSKRHAAASIKELYADGILPQALCNYIALLGWSYDDSREFFTIAELETLFSVSAIHKSPARFDMQKLLWFNKHYLQRIPDADFQTMIVNEISPIIDVTIINGTIADVAQTLTQPLKERINIIHAARQWVEFLREIPALRAQLVMGKKLSAAQTIALLDMVTHMENATLNDSPLVEQALKQFAEEQALPFGPCMGVIRYSLTAAKASLPVAVLLRLLSASEIRTRLQRAVATVKNMEYN